MRIKWRPAVHLFLRSVLILLISSFGAYRLLWGVSTVPISACPGEVNCPDMSLHAPRGRVDPLASLHLYVRWLGSEPVFLALAALVLICSVAAIVGTRPVRYPLGRN